MTYYQFQRTAGKTTRTDETPSKGGPAPSSKRARRSPTAPLEVWCGTRTTQHGSHRWQAWRAMCEIPLPKHHGITSNGSTPLFVEALNGGNVSRGTCPHPGGASDEGGAALRDSMLSAMGFEFDTEDPQSLARCLNLPLLPGNSLDISLSAYALLKEGRQSPVARVYLQLRTRTTRKTTDISEKRFVRTLDALEAAWVDVGGLTSTYAWLDRLAAQEQAKATQAEREDAARHLYEELRSQLEDRARKAVNYEARLEALQSELNETRAGLLPTMLAEEGSEGWVWTGEDGSIELMEPQVVAAVLRVAKELAAPRSRAFASTRTSNVLTAPYGESFIRPDDTDDTCAELLRGLFESMVLGEQDGC